MSDMGGSDFESSDSCGGDAGVGDVGGDDVSASDFGEVSDGCDGGLDSVGSDVSEPIAEAPVAEDTGSWAEDDSSVEEDEVLAQDPAVGETDAELAGFDGNDDVPGPDAVAATKPPEEPDLAAARGNWGGSGSGDFVRPVWRTTTWRDSGTTPATVYLRSGDFRTPRHTRTGRATRSSIRLPTRT